ncbi:MAG: hypothetical protein JWM80_4037 [Cyanobacteria bacterium RYN_339]|nr:hypothetical protein [Cyanobacteria bacterium RYN_339]
MRQPTWLGGFGVAALLMAAGCEDLPTTVTVAASPTPYGSPSPSPSPSGSPYGSPSPKPSYSPSPTPTPRYTPTPTPHPTERVVTPTATPRPVATTTGGSTPTPVVIPVITAPASLVLDAPDSTADFSKNVLPVSLRAEVPAGVAIRELQVIYENQVIFRQLSPSLAFSTSSWNPHLLKPILNDSAAYPIPYGMRKIKGRAVTTAGTESFSSVLEFYKPLIFRDWVTKTTNASTQITIPPLPIARSGAKLYAAHNKLFTFFGTKADGTAADSVIALGLDVFNPTWNLQSAPTLTWRKGFAFTGSGDTAYVIGGRPAGASGLADATPSVQAIDLFAHVITSLPPLPKAVVDASAAIMGHHLYVIGGSTTGAAADAVSDVYRIALTTDDTPAANAAWESRASLQTALRGTAAIAVSNGTKLFMLGGQAVDGSRREGIYAYDEALDLWSRVQLLPAQVSDGSVADLGDAIWYLGGTSDDKPSRALFRFNYADKDMPARAFPNGVPNLPVERTQPSAAVLGDTDSGQPRRRLFVLSGDRLDADKLVPVAEVLVGDTL